MSFNPEPPWLRSEEMEAANQDNTFSPDMFNTEFLADNETMNSNDGPSLFEGPEFDRFIGNVGRDTSSDVDNETFLSKDISFSDDSLLLPKFGNNGVFNSQEAFSSLLNGGEFDMGPSPAPSITFDAPPEEKSFGKTFPAEAAPSTGLEGTLTSREWVPFGNLGGHVDVPYDADMLFSGEEEKQQQPKSDWNKLFLAELCAPQLQAPQPQLVPLPEDEVIDAEADAEEVQSAKMDEDTSPKEADLKQPPVADKPAPTKKAGPKRKRKRKPREKVLPSVYRYVEPVDSDVLLGRGGKSNHHVGNKRYREEVKNLQNWYKGIDDKDEKTDLSQCLVDYVHSYGGRFLEKNAEGWYVVPNIVARRKASQALREDNDPQKRAAKRARHLEKKKNAESQPKEGGKSER